MSDSVRSHRWQPTRLHSPWDSPGKKTGVGCHLLLQCMKAKSESEVAQSCLTLSHPMDCSLLGSSVHEIFQARVLEWGAIAFSGDAARVTEKLVSYLKVKVVLRFSPHHYLSEVSLFHKNQGPVLLYLQQRDAISNWPGHLQSSFYVIMCCCCCCC